MVIDEIWIEALRQKAFSMFFRGDAVLIPIQDVPAFLDWVEPKRALLGAEGFTYAKGKRMPLMNCIIDYSQGAPGKSIAFHRNIIVTDPAWKEVDFVEFVLASPTRKK